MPETIRLQADTYLGILIPLVAPVFALQEPLSVYRIHGQNLYHSQGKSLSPGRRKTRIDTMCALSDAIKAWARCHQHKVTGREARLFLDRWLLWTQQERFQFDPPGRLPFFWFLVVQNHAQVPMQTWKLTVFNYLSAFSALVYGYKRAHLMYEWRRRTMETLQHFLGRPANREKT
jgi:hypothetical protein